MKITLEDQLGKIYAHQGDDRYLYDAAVQAGAKGIVVATTGGYTLSAQTQAGIPDAINSEVLVRRSSRLATGFVSRTEMDNQYGYIISGSLNPPKARILLMLALSLTNDKEETQNYFYRY
ncbi:hypothetical protein ACTL32_10980 [Planococcus sp. FY231025]|uniref:hypothetical protein n=1 Tax=Planococcus sp. FY231025 TaxID=3455699 RepID=UPI003F9007D7